MNNTHFAIFITLHRILVKGQKHYAVPSIASLLELLASRHRLTIGRRWLFQCLHDLEAAGFISRHRRFTRNHDLNWKQIPSMISVTLKGARYLFSKGIEGAAALVKKMLNWCRGPDKRFPDAAKMLSPLTTEEIDRNKIHIRELLATIG
jgi:hypothetical protein